MVLSLSTSGTTWVSYILDLLYFAHMGQDRQTSIPLHDRVPFLEICEPPMPKGLRSVLIAEIFCVSHVETAAAKMQPQCVSHSLLSKQSDIIFFLLDIWLFFKSIWLLDTQNCLQTHSKVP